MKKNAGIFGALAVVLAIFGMSSLPRNSSLGGAQSTTANAKRSKVATRTPKDNRPGLPVFAACDEIQTRLQPLVTGDAPPKWTLPDFCYTGTKPKTDLQLNLANVDFVIATAPNPVSTHLPLSFDRILEIIQQAAQDNDYSYESSWLPWNEAREYTHFADELSAEDAQDLQEKQPGVLVFRNPPSKIGSAGGEGGLVVFVISELPTAGINHDEFHNALAWIHQLGGLSSNRKVNILGPNFSGSLPSLFKALQNSKWGSFSGEKRINVFSGSVTSDATYKWFSDRFVADGLGSFHTAMEGDSVQLNRFCEYVHSQGYETNRIAFLSEDETAFGGRAEASGIALHEDPCMSSGGPTYLYYPRDIATLRSAYEQQSIFNSAKQASGANNVATTLRGDLSEPANSEHDTVRSYGGQLTPLAQESVLLAITDVLKAKKIQFVVVRSTNSLDQIFLGQFLRRSIPETRIVMDGADLMFRRGAEGASLRGVMMLSTYPLLTWQQEWTSSVDQPLTWQQLLGSPPQPEKGESYRIFGEDNAEGVYVAARELFPDQSYDDKAPQVYINGYVPPRWARSPDDNDWDKRPATWLTVIGHRQFWPIAVLNPHTLQDSPKDSLLSTFCDLQDMRFAVAGDPTPMGRLPVEFGLLVVLCFGWSVLHLLWCMRGSISPVPLGFRLAYFAPIPRCQHPLLIGFGSVLVASAAMIVAGTSGLINGVLGVWNLVVAGFILLTFLLAFIACWRNYKLPPMTDDEFTSDSSYEWRWIAAVGSIVFLIAFMIVELILLLKLNISNRIPTFWRSVHLLSGVSPLLPQMFLLAGMYCWFWFCLRGLSLFGSDRPLLPNMREMLVEGKPMAIFSREKAQTPTENAAMPIGRSYLKLLGLILPTVLAVSAMLLNGRPWLRTLGERKFGYFMFFWIVLCISLILADTAEAWSSWRRLRVLLNHIDLVPLRRTLNALHGLTWRSVWAMSGNVLGERYCLFSRQIEAMRHLENQVMLWVPANTADTETKTDLIKQIDDFMLNKMKPFGVWYRSFFEGIPNALDVEYLLDVQRGIASIAGFLFVHVLMPAWHAEKDSLIIDRRPKKNKEDENRVPLIYPDMPKYVLAAEEFFVLPYLGFIQNILGRIRTIVLGSLCLFVATTLAVSSYPFDPLPMLGGIFLAVFVITGTTIVLIYAGMHRDATLSYITDTSPGELGGEFWRQVFAFGVGPFIGLLTTLFPSITDFVASWLQPSSQVIK